MKTLPIVCIALALAFVLGCDGDGDGDGAGTTVEETGTAEGPKGPVTILTDSETITVGGGIVKPFDIHEKGVIEARVEWSSGPPTLYISLTHSDTLTKVVQPLNQSPAIIAMQATQDLLDKGGQWEFNVENLSLSEQVTIDYMVTFTPN